ncbi:3-oxoacyl-[ACP] synthase FabV like [hydrothermal vent metagenome]|uniref:3-oxoacyl-[ACP] synthase FabV like n=1 Tax=hydrothermal vent metagenome TaxID=652676 RepID=A0A3B0WGB5_9ZZZZ
MHILASSLVSSLGSGKIEHVNALLNGTTGLSSKMPFHSKISEIETYLGEVKQLEDIQLPSELLSFHCRNNQLAWQALQSNGFAQKVQRLIKRFGAQRIGLVVGTSTSGIMATEEVFSGELAHEDYDYEKTDQMGVLAQFCCEALNIQGPSFVISTACSSSAKVFSVAQRWLNANIVDVVVAGGVDTLCLTTVHGFNALGLVSKNICKPLDVQRDGISIGEAGGFVLLGDKHNKHIMSENFESLVEVVGVGESSDAYHISSPHPEGKGAQLAMLSAMEQAGISIDDVDYINLHGTATSSNDISEISAISHLVNLNSQIWISSTKGFVGHTLGAAGITEIIFCQWALEEQFVPANLNLEQLDPVLALKLESELAAKSVKVPLKSESLTTEQPKMIYAMSNSFGFGGNNASVLLKKEGA